jgi:hypothetical protein
MAARLHFVAKTECLEDAQTILEDRQTVSARTQGGASLVKPDGPALARELDTHDETGDTATHDFR